jgi:hypothetical protein
MEIALLEVQRQARFAECDHHVVGSYPGFSLAQRGAHPTEAASFPIAGCPGSHQNNHRHG